MSICIYQYYAVQGMNVSVPQKNRHVAFGIPATVAVRPLGETCKVGPESTSG